MIWVAPHTCATIALQMATRAETPTVWQEQVLQLRRIGLSDSDIGLATGAAAQTVRSWASGTRSPRDVMQWRLAELSECIARAQRLFRNELLVWLKRPVELLGDRTPLAALAAGDVNQILGVLSGIEDGDFV